VPNNRQWASLVWMLGLLGWALARRDARVVLRNVLRVTASLTILVPLVALLGWVIGLVYIASRSGLQTS
jgi:hypothetical protein